MHFAFFTTDKSWRRAPMEGTLTTIKDTYTNNWGLGNQFMLSKYDDLSRDLSVWQCILIFHRQCKFQFSLWDNQHAIDYFGWMRDLASKCPIG